MKADLRYYLGNMDSINITPIRPVLVLHLYLMHLWACQNILHILFPCEHLCKAKKVARNKKGKNPIKEIKRGKHPEREWEHEQEIGDPALLKWFKGLFNAKAFSISDIPCLHLGPPGPRPTQWPYHPGRFLELASSRRGFTQAQHRGKNIGLQDRSQRILVTFQVITWNPVSSN